MRRTVAIVVAALAVPAAGPARGQFLPPTERGLAFADWRKVMADLARASRRDSAAKRVEAWADDYPEELTRRLERTFKAAAESIRRKRRPHRARLEKLLARYAKAMETIGPKQVAAVALIRDQSKYHKRGDTVVGQEAVDRAVAELDAPAEALAAYTRALGRLQRAERNDLRTLTALAAAYEIAAKRLASLKVPYIAAARKAELPDLSAAKLSESQATLLEQHRLAAEANAEEDLGMREDEAAFITRLNEYRLKLGLRPVWVDARLVRAARGHSEDMSSRGFFAHESPVPGKKSPTDRVRKEGYPGGASENIHYGMRARASDDARAAASFDGWYHSPPHHRNMIGRYHDAGVGYAVGTKGMYATLNLGNAGRSR